MLDLQYLIVYENDGTPIYSRCFGNMCKIAMKDEFLFSAFLSSLMTFAKITDEKFDELEIEGMKVKVEYQKEGDMINLVLEDLKLVFVYNEAKNYTIAAGFDLESYEKHAVMEKTEAFLNDVDAFVAKHDNINWKNVSTIDLLAFESALLRDVIHTFFATHNTKDRCPFGDNCPLRMAMYEGKGNSIYDRLKNKLADYRGMSMMGKMKRMMFGSKYKTSN